MSPAAVLSPVFVQVALTFALLIWMGRRRFAAVRAGEVRIGDIMLGERAWPAPVTQVANTFHNQFETPVLFYAVVGLALVTRQADALFVALSWLWVATRLVHAYVYVTTNVLMRRFRAFLAGTLVLMLMWLLLAVRVFLAGA